MPPRIRPNHNQRSGTLPVDDEVEAVIVTPYLFNPATDEYEPQGAAVIGNWSYYSGNSGVVVVEAGQRVVGIAAHSAAGGSMSINGGQTVPIPAGSGVAITPGGNLVAPTIIFTDTDSYFIEVVS